jgi:hypothetical protein
MSYSLPSQNYTTPLSRLTLYLVKIIPHLYHVLLFTAIWHEVDSVFYCRWSDMLEAGGIECILLLISF